MAKLIYLVLCGAAAGLMSLPAQSTDEARSRAGVNASVEGGASLGGTGLDGTMADPRRSAERPAVRIPSNRHDASKGSASTGSSSRDTAPAAGTDLGREAEKEDEEYRKKERARRGGR
jgi:hypothetical protein